MATMTLLEMTQNILNAMDSDPVTAITDTVESAQVAEIIKETYYDLISQRDWPFLRALTTLTAADVSNPTRMRIPTNVNKVYWIRYNKKIVEYMDPASFKEMIDKRVEQTGVINSSGYIINADPQYWTTYDDDYLFFDGYKSTVDTTGLTAAKSSAFVLTIPTWTHTGSSTPTLPEKMFSTFLADAKGSCFLNLKQQANAKEEAKAKRGKVRFQNEAWKVDAAEHGYSKVNYGRK